MENSECNIKSGVTVERRGGGGGEGGFFFLFLRNETKDQEGGLYTDLTCRCFLFFCFFLFGFSFWFLVFGFFRPQRWAVWRVGNGGFFEGACKPDGLVMMLDS